MLSKYQSLRAEKDKIRSKIDSGKLIKMKEDIESQKQKEKSENNY
jgi:hypothetical protein